MRKGVSPADMNNVFNAERHISRLDEIDPLRVNGRVTKVVGLVIEGYSPSTPVGDICEIHPRSGDSSIKAKVVGFRDDKVLLMPMGEIGGLNAGSIIVSKGEKTVCRIGEGLLGRVIDGLGNPIDGKGPIADAKEYETYRKPINPLLRKRIKEPLDLGIRAINGLLTCGKGQRIGIMAGSGVGKSVLMGMMARYTSADVNVIALIGERGREVNEFIEKDLKEEGLKRSVVVVATSDQPPLVRTSGAFTATAIAEYFREKGHDVLLMMDSVTRFAMAQREIGLAIGEPPTTRGYTPSVFAVLPKLLERAGTCEGDGSITGLYTVLVEGDDMNEPVADAVRSILDGHIVLSRDIAARGHYPAIDVLASASRVMIDIVSDRHRKAAQRLISILAEYRKAEDLINIGAYKSGSNPQVDYAISKIGEINRYLRQDVYERVAMEDSIGSLISLFEK
jgi:flagellum-specific ATP synthase